MTIYEHTYPPKLTLGDALELETLTDRLEHRFRLSSDDLCALWASDPTLLDIVKRCIECSNRAQQFTSCR